jgi:hypothetical protein
MRTIFAVLLVACIAIPVAGATSPKKERVLWIETHKHGDKTASIAVSVALAQHLLDKDEKSDETPIDREMITREMVEDVLSGRKESVSAEDPKTGETARLWLGTLEMISSSGDDEGDLVIEVFKKGKRSFSLRLPFAEEQESREEDDPNITKMTFGWNSLMPFMAETKGVVYVKTYDEDTEFWMYVE